MAKLSQKIKLRLENKNIILRWYMNEKKQANFGLILNMF